jgi:DNA (cytosine-5)-methyltransferase 1
MKSIDLFSGAGGLTLGLKEAGFEVAAAVEFKKDAMDTFCGHSPDAIHYNQDVRTVDFTKFKGQVPFVSGGPPCQPFSLGGLRRADKDRRDMIPEFIRCLREVQPEAFLMENVPGLLTKHTRPYFESVLTQLSSLGYRLNWGVLNAADYGVPQKRRRLFVLGARHMFLRFPRSTHGEGTKKRHIASKQLLKSKPVGEVPNCPVKYASYPDLRPSPYAGQLYNGGGRPIDPDGPCHTILASSGGYKTHWVDTEGIAPKYHAHLSKGGKPWVGEVPGARRLSVEECAMIQTFPADLAFAGSRASRYTQVGDAVPPVLGAALGQAIMFQLMGKIDERLLLEPTIEYESIQAMLAL